MSKPDPDAIISAYQDAYLRANGEERWSMDYAHGWYRIARGGYVTKYRLRHIEEMTDVLKRRAQS